MKVFLMGYMGSGKTTAGKMLANKLGLPFHDLDQMIEMGESKSVAELFAEHGEAWFRKKEREYVNHWCLNHDSGLLALGGGTPCFFDTINFLKVQGITVYLKMPPKALYSRLAGGLSKRPLLAGKSEEELVLFIEKHLAEREVYYEMADVILPALHLDLVAAVEHIRRIKKA